MVLTFRIYLKIFLSYGYDFKYFLNFVRLHLEKNKVNFSILNNLNIRIIEHGIIFNSKNMLIGPKSLARARASLKSFLIIVF